ncbi:thioredoxin family protein [Natronogracilivirga saccharolytica]|uniref:Thioredoxin family protein n=1 Tax=Natronogracilivirga saccharolytica TaxID=2812953 RepID=A0A8J7RK23_9BACT|nr:thioredoxin family protein [Natronogracilivirga saccharolytica]MBP3191583.1 thioredoxin family protein [Natronogracilivirga saccharolytica]
MKLIGSSLTILLIAFSFIGTAISAGSDTPSVGDTAPDFTLKDAYGEAHSLSDYEGEYIVLEWLNHECPFVIKHYDSGNMQMLQEYYGDKGVVWFSIISSAPGKQGYLEPDEASEITKQKEASPKGVLLDPDGVVGRAYDAKVTPHMYIINPEGELVYMGAIDDNPSANPDDIEGARNFVSEALDNLLDGQPVEVQSHQPYGCTVKY